MDLLAELLDLLVTSAVEAFIQVGVFVGAVLLLFQYINYKQQGALITRIEGAAKWQPAIGALLGLTPGCGGAIFVMTLYLKGSVTFGTVAATLVSTMGDAAFVLIAAAPRQFLYVSALSLVAAIATGYAVDAIGLGAKLRPSQRDAARKSKSRVQAELDRHAASEHGATVRALESELVVDSAQLAHVGHMEGDALDIALHHAMHHGPHHGPHHGHHHGRPEYLGSLGYRLTHHGFIGYWLILAVGLAFGIATVLDFDLGESLGVPWLTLVLGLGGTVYGIMLTIAAKRFGLNTTHEDEEHKLFSLRETLIHGGMDTAFVTTWVFVSFVAYHLGVLVLGGGDLAAGELIMAGWLQRTGIATVVAGALLGLIPGCGPQIVFITMFARGLLPFAAVLANAISQDGDALFPLLVLDRRSAVWATLVTTVPALILGLLVYMLETQTALGSLLGR